MASVLDTLIAAQKPVYAPVFVSGDKRFVLTYSAEELSVVACVSASVANTVVNYLRSNPIKPCPIGDLEVGQVDLADLADSFGIHSYLTELDTFGAIGRIAASNACIGFQMVWSPLK